MWSAMRTVELAKIDVLHFNLRAHVERDIDQIAVSVIIYLISTHALTWSATIEDRLFENQL